MPTSNYDCTAINYSLKIKIMKTKHLSLIIALVFVTNFSFSQEAQEDFRAPDGVMISNTHNFECMPDAVFSRIPLTYNGGAFADVSYTFTKVAESYSASAPISTMRFWGYRDIKTTEDFLIEFYDGTPGAPGTSVIHTFNVSISPIGTGFTNLGLEIFQFDVDFGTNIKQLNGWLSIS